VYISLCLFIDSTVIRQPSLAALVLPQENHSFAAVGMESKEGIFRRESPFFIKTKEYSAKVRSEPGYAGSFTKDSLV